jgi:SnoaL-like domain
MPQRTASWLQTRDGTMTSSTWLNEEAAMATNSVIDSFLHAIESAAIPSCEAWSADATLDATVPNWRLHAAGPDAIRAEYARWFADPGHFDQVRRVPLADGGGEVIEYTLSWEENGEPHAAHHMHLLTLRDGKIIADTVMCGGRWPASLLAEMESANAGG